MRTVAYWTGGLIALMLSSANAFIGEQEKMEREPAQNRGAKRLLVVTHTAGFRHADSIETGEKIVAELAQQSGRFTVSYCRDAGEVQKMLTPEYLDANRFDGVIFLNTTGDIGIPDLKAFLEWLKGGKAFIGIHA
ncbi:MAG: ThuA domain-containing protein, partial [Fimbriimonadales bacterium]|nr:ThuA domain-containing protein [Fimbriimonadales bacterium]